jgi:hypothetical protein
LGQIVSPLVEHPPHPAAIAGSLGPTLAIAGRGNCHQLLNQDGDEPAPMRDSAGNLPADRWAIAACVRVRERKRPAGASGGPVAID